MNGAHIHLILTHLPIVLIPTSLSIYAFGHLKSSGTLKKCGLLLLTLAALVTFPTYLSGESAEHTVKGLTGITKSSIETHEDVAKLALGITLGTGVIAFLSLLLKKQVIEKFAMLLGGLATVALGVTGLRGGEIRHPEISLAPAASSDLNQKSSEKNETEDSEHKVRGHH